MNKTIIIFILIAVIFFSAGMGAGILISGSLDKQNNLNFVVKTEQQPEEEQREEMPKFTVPEVLYNLIGLIQDIDDDFIIIEAEIPFLDENHQIIYKMEERKILISENTVLKSLNIVKQEKTNKKIIQESLISLQDLKIGDQIEAIANKDISQGYEFTASQIRIMP
ncbi:hypothetical protein KAU19_01690 [Candidatus Parcubacteria bacterium]|nr:hypothetical protein [Candidatus Parcubacteria bacterium]